MSVVAKHCCLHDTDLDNLRMLIDDKKVVKLRLLRPTLQFQEDCFICLFDNKSQIPNPNKLQKLL